MLSGKNAYAATDFASYTDVWWAIIQLYQLCTLNYQTPGWVPIGESLQTSFAHIAASHDNSCRALFIRYMVLTVISRPQQLNGSPALSEQQHRR